jgi:hypothetical protein
MYAKASIYIHLLHLSSLMAVDAVNNLTFNLNIFRKKLNIVRKTMPKNESRRIMYGCRLKKNPHTKIAFELTQQVYALPPFFRSLTIAGVSLGSLSLPASVSLP